MASAGTEHYSIGLRQGNGFKQTGPAPALPPEKRCEGQVWPQAHQQVKPIWKLEKKHVGTLSAELGPGVLGPPQPAYFFCPSTLCSPGPTAVLAGHSNSCYLHSLPDLVSHTLLHRRSNCRDKTYQQLESFCLRSSPSERRSFSLPQKSFPVRLTANQATSLPVSPMAQPTTSSSTDPYFSLGAAGEIPSGNSLASAISGKSPSPLCSSSSSSYKPTLNNNSFMRPNSTKVPLSQATEGLKPLSSPRIHLASWHHSGGTGDCALQPIEHKVPKSNGTVLEDALARSTLAFPSSLDTSATSIASPQSNQSNLATRAKPHPFGLDGDSASQALSREVRFTEAVRKLTARGFEPPRQGCQFEQSCFMNPSLQWDLNRNRRWKPAVDPPFPQEDAGTDGRTLPGASDALELDSTVFCTKRISVHLPASHANGLSHSPACGSASDSPPLGEDKIPVLPSPPQPCGLADVATRLSSIHLGQLGKEGPKEARELDSSSRDIG